MQPNTVVVDRSTVPASMTFAETFNVCGPLVDRHLTEGRADKPVARGRTWTLTFGELHDGVCRMANVLRSLGVEAGDRVMLLAKDGPPFYIGFLGAVRIGAVVIPTNTFLRAAVALFLRLDRRAESIGARA